MISLSECVAGLEELQFVNDIFSAILFAAGFCIGWLLFSPGCAMRKPLNSKEKNTIL